jgi:hypothetical protein
MDEESSKVLIADHTTHRFGPPVNLASRKSFRRRGRMGPLEYELRWERVWNVLALDASRIFQDELRIPGDVERLQVSLRETLDDHYAANEFMCAAGLLSLRLGTKLQTAFREVEVLRLFAWGDYCSDLVQSRVGEFIWSSALHLIDELKHPEWLGAKFLKMRSELSSRREQIKNALGAIQLTDRDSMILHRIAWTSENLLTNFSLVAGYNAFDQLWHENMREATPEELDEVYGFGKALAQKQRIEETQLCYPGMWEAGPQHTLLRLKSD